MNKKMFIKVLLFNLLEIISVFIIGMGLKVNKENIIIIVLLFPIARFIFKKPMHYKSPYLCFIVTMAIFVSLFLLLNVDFIVSLVITLFSGFILTDNANICDMFMWSGRTTQYQDIIDYVNENNNKIEEFESRISEQDTLSYLVYKYRFKDKLSFQKISDILEIETNRITDIQEKVAFAFRIFMNI